VRGNLPTPAEIFVWTVEAGLRETDIKPVVAGFVDRLSAAVPGLARLLIGAPTLHPTIVSWSWIWQRGQPLEGTQHSIDTAADEDWLSSPIYYAMQTGVSRIRCDLTDPEQVARFPVYRTFAAGGHTDYLLRMVSFEEEKLASGIEGMIVTFLCDAPVGFSPTDLATIEKVLPALGLAMFRLAVSEVARNLLSAYLGSDAGKRVLGGKVRRGDVERIKAAVFFADLRHYTDISERMAADEMVAWLNAGLAALGDPTARHGGEILKFLGDGLLAIFPTETGEADACRRALAAATDGLEALSALNGPAANGHSYEADIALHIGEVAYGNIGASNRLDFTAIGPTVNEVSRMETLCDALGVHLVMSEPFACHAGVPVRDLGTHRLRGLSQPRRLVTLTES
jgi:adenylate cyclase